MVAVPVHSPDGIPVGVVGRTASSTHKVFKNSVGLPTSKTFFNIHRAKRESSTVIVTEASFDTLAVHQSGYPNVVGNLGGHMSPEKLYLLDRHFDKIILFLDNPVIDASGRTLGEKIAKVFSKRKDVSWAKTDNWLSGWYPDDLKDASAILQEFGEDHIRQTIEGAIPIWEYESTMVQYNLRAANVPNTN
jgi:DNA primase